jgi:transposase
LRTRRDIRTGNEPKLRRFIESIWYMCRSGCQWRLLPSWYGSWWAVHQRFKEWSHKGIWEALFEKIQHCPDYEFTMIDATIVRAHACSAGYGKGTQDTQALGRSKGGFTTKIHALVDALGNPLKFILTPGQRHEITQAPTYNKRYEKYLGYCR